MFSEQFFFGYRLVNIVGVSLLSECSLYVLKQVVSRGKYIYFYNVSRKKNLVGLSGKL